ncbi:hypothetical protein AVEN_16528-1 [Araneus ventricosus]|uniref:Uncharacterized protein n=1 Tax=Araneus ventricosus TaxID=182803 RepID=A0A4Y2W0Z3_ARAVE|nr:hypothetical protein AVEN_16528-1 [Araneus ventricosus]
MFTHSSRQLPTPAEDVLSTSDLKCTRPTNPAFEPVAIRSRHFTRPQLPILKQDYRRPSRAVDSMSNTSLDEHTPRDKRSDAWRCSLVIASWHPRFTVTTPCLCLVCIMLFTPT